MKPDWLEFANCRGKTDAFFPDGGGNYIAARRLCASCEVRAECLADCLAVEARLPRGHFRSGMYGGLTPTQRVAAARNAA